MADRTGQARNKKECVIEAVRRGLEGEAAMAFIRQSGYAMSVSGIARHLRSLGGRGRVQAYLDEGRSNEEVLALCLPVAEGPRPPKPPKQSDLFEERAESRQPRTLPFPPPDKPLYETTRMSIKLPSELYEAIRLAARGEAKSQNQLIVEILTEALSRMPGPGHCALDDMG